MGHKPTILLLLGLALALPTTAQAGRYRRSGPSTTAYGPVYNLNDANQARQYQQMMQRQQQQMMREYQAEMRMQQQYLKMQQQYMKQQQQQGQKSGVNSNQAQQAFGSGSLAQGQLTRRKKRPTLHQKSTQGTTTQDQATAPVDPSDPFGLNKPAESESQTKTRRSVATPTASTSAGTATKP